MSKESNELWDKIRQIPPNWLPGVGHVFAIVVTPEERETLLYELSPTKAFPTSVERIMKPPENLVERCKEVLAWKASGVLEGEALRRLAKEMPDHDYALRLAETMTADQAMQFVIDAHNAAGSAAQKEGN